MADELAGWVALLMPSAIPCSLSLLVFSKAGGIWSQQNSLTHSVEISTYSSLVVLKFRKSIYRIFGF